MAYDGCYVNIAPLIRFKILIYGCLTGIDGLVYVGRTHLNIGM